MENENIKNSQITTTGYDELPFGWQVRLNRNIRHGGAWCANTSGGTFNVRNYDQHIMIDLLSTMTNITGIATQGRQYYSRNERVKDYKLSYLKPGNGIWYFYRKKDCFVRVSLIKLLGVIIFVQKGKRYVAVLSMQYTENKHIRPAIFFIR